MSFYFAWVDSTDTAFTDAMKRVDADIFSFQVEHEEGDFAALTLEIKNPRIGLLNTGRKRWAWLAWNNAGTAVPLFFGRLVGAPESAQGELITLQFIAKPGDFEAQKEALAETLRVLPFFDPAWTAADKRAEPDLVLEARSALWHVDRLTHEVTISDIIQGEAGTMNIAGDFYGDSLDMAFVEVPGRQVRVVAEMAWDQQARGTVDVSAAIRSAFAVAGSGYARLCSSFTGEGLMRDWPAAGRVIGSGWQISEVSLRRVDGIDVPRRGLEARITGQQRAYFPLWQVDATMKLAYDVSRARTETVSFTVEADTQAIIAEPGEVEVIELALRSSAAGELIDGALPIGDVRRRSYFQTDRGASSIQYLILLARARLLARSRAVEVSAEIPWATARDLTCRHSVTLTDARLPGGTATGKVVGYGFGMNGDSGALVGRVTIACTVGKGGTLSSSSPQPGWVEAGYIADGYQALTSGDAVLPTADVAFEYQSTAIDDDGVDFLALTPAQVVLSCTVTNGETDQRAVLRTLHPDIKAAAAALNAACTRVDLDMRPLDGLAFQTDYVLTVADLKVPKSIDLEAGAS